VFEMKYIKVMCGRFTLDLTTKFYERFKVANRLDGLKARYNIAPTQDVPVIVRIKSLISCGTTPNSLPSCTHLPLGAGIAVQQTQATPKNL